MPVKILIDGDFISEHHIFKGARPFPDSDNKQLGSRIIKQNGGAHLLVQLSERLCQTRKKDTKSRDFEILSENGDQRRVMPEHGHAYALWKPCLKTTRKEDTAAKTEVWRVTEMLGYGSRVDTADPESGHPGISPIPGRANIVLLDDAGLGYRFKPGGWPDCLKASNPDKPDWILLKMSHPLCQGDLWVHLREHFGDRLVLIASAGDLRRSEVMISQGRSWEQTVQDLLRELNNNAALSEMLKCRHLVVNFRSEGAVWIDNPSSDIASRRLVFDTGHLEGEWGKDLPGEVLGRSSCFTAGILSALIDDLGSEGEKQKTVSGKPDLAMGIRRGLSAVRFLREEGFGSVQNGIPKGFPAAAIVEHFMTRKDNSFSTASIGKEALNGGKDWTLIDGGGNDKARPLYGHGRRVAWRGPNVLQGIPHGEFGSLLTVDRRELESLNGIRQLIEDYVKQDSGKKPLSIGVFGPPGAGKSFGIREIAKGILGNHVPVLEFNLSQFGKQTEMLVSALHQVRDKALLGVTPVVFWDEFDSLELFWLQYLLAPMQDGAFLEGQLSHPIGKCIFVFAGGTRYTMESFSPTEGSSEYEMFKLKKGPDFVSRLRGSLNVLGPNLRLLYNPQSDRQDKHDPDPADICFPIRRALLLRVLARVKKKGDLKIDSGLLNAFIKIGKYKHGARSMETLVNLMNGKKDGLMRSNLPPREQMEIHVDYDEFLGLIDQDTRFKAGCTASTPVLAEHAHNFYRQLAKDEKWKDIKYDMPFAELPSEIKDDNVAAAKRIPNVLSLVGLQVVSESLTGPGSDHEKVATRIERHIELLAEAEHDGWMETKLQNGWKFGEIRDDDQKIHNCLIEYAALSEKDKDKDRNSVRHYPDIVSEAGYAIVFESGAG